MKILIWAAAVCTAAPSVGATLIPGSLSSLPPSRAIPAGPPELAPVSPFSDLVLLVPSSLRSVGGERPSVFWVPARLSDDLPRMLEGGASATARYGLHEPQSGSMPTWQLESNPMFASAAYGRFSSTGYESWTSRFEPGSNFGRENFRPEPYGSVGNVDAFRSSVEQNPAFSYGSAGF